MAISKPSWLRRALDKLNWDILNWKVYVGDTIEEGIDWTVGKINDALTWANNAWVRAGVAWDKAVEVGKDAWSDLCKEATKIWNNIDTWWDDLGDWWEAKKTDIGDWIDERKEWLLDRIDDVREDLEKLGDTWDNFWQDTWPQLLKDFGALGVTVGNFFTTILPGLATLTNLYQAFDDFRLDWQTLFDFWGSFWKDVMEFFIDPLEWLLGRFTDWFLGPEE
ncbi:hypothetical protein ES708_35246 [subsurface metagenome]